MMNLQIFKKAFRVLLLLVFMAGTQNLVQAKTPNPPGQNKPTNTEHSAPVNPNNNGQAGTGNNGNGFGNNPYGNQGSGNGDDSNGRTSGNRSTSIPLDGGLSILAIVAGVFGVKRLRKF
jgi:hypothetical protein